MKMHMPKLKPLSSLHRLGWYSASLGFGLCLVAIAVKADVFANRESFPVAAFIFGTFWLIGVVLLRFYIQQVEDPTSFKSIFGAGRRRRK